MSQPGSELRQMDLFTAASGSSESSLVTRLYILLENKTLNHFDTALEVKS